MKRLLLLLLLISAGCRFGCGATYPGDVSALKSVMKQWKNTPPSWVNSGDPCGDSWEGVNCTNSRVTGLKLFAMNIQGTLSEDIGNLTELQTLDLSSNELLGGMLPPSIGNLSQLTFLRLLGCSFVGAIPDEIGNLPQLSFLALNSNKFTGRIPPSLGKLSNLYWLDLADNQLSGPLPTSANYGSGLDQLLQAQHFHLNKNLLNGSIPDDLFNSSMILRHLLLDRNNLVGPIPTSIGGILSLEVLRLNNNNLSNTVPSNINNLSKLHVLNLANNKLTGPLPNLTGMPRLRTIDISNNAFDLSEAPDWLSALPGALTITMQSCGLQGEVPSGLFSLQNLQQLSLADNHLNGTLDMGDSVSQQLSTANLESNDISAVRITLSYNYTLMLAGNPVCGNPYLAGTAYCQNQQSSSDSISSRSVSCDHPFEEVVVFRATAFTYLNDYIGQLRDNATKLLNCTPNTFSLQNFSFNDDGYLTAVFLICPLNKKYFSRTEVLNCLDLNNVNISTDVYGPYYAIANPYSFQGSTAFGLLIGLIVGVVAFVVILFLVVLYAVRQKKRAESAISLGNPFASWGSDGEEIGDAPKLRGARAFSYEELKSCTNGFVDINVIGKGGYGKVFRGMLPDGTIVAIKKWKQGSMQGSQEFKAEVEMLSRVHHRNLVGLIGFCFTKGERMLVYEFIPNGTLSEALSGIGGIHLNWVQRLMIALDSSQGIAYLHDYADPPIIHRDVKSSNILLDDSLTAKVADFGLSLLVSDTESSFVSSKPKGTPGYVDPEYFMSLQLTTKSDVYSFGVVMLELITARPPIHNKKNMVREVRDALDLEDEAYCGLVGLIDPIIKTGERLPGFKRFLRLALQCVEESPESRPSMNDVVKEIEAIMEDVGLRRNSISDSMPRRQLNMASRISDLYGDSTSGSSNITRSGFSSSGVMGLSSMSWKKVELR